MKEEEVKLSAAAISVLSHTGFSVLDAARLAATVHEVFAVELQGMSASMMQCQRIIQLGTEAYRQEHCSICFQEAVEKSLLSRAMRRPRTLNEIRQCHRRILLRYPEIGEMAVRRISPGFCQMVIQNSFTTPATRRKARRLLHGLFAFCLRHGWCAFNPVESVDLPPARERRIEALSLAEIRRLLSTLLRTEYRPCAPAVGIMLWAGIRPTELTRLHWADLSLRDKVICVEAQHSKTGGARHVTIPPVLAKWLQMTAPFRLPDARIVPTSWVRRWHAVRMAAGFSVWHPDTLRHTFASYHLKHFKDFNQLMLEMGHADASLLRTRYLNMRGVTAESAAAFWQVRFPASIEAERDCPPK